MVISIYASAADDVRRKLDGIARKAARVGVPFAYSFGAEYTREVKTCDAFAPVYHVAAVDVTISDDLIAFDGWRVLARIEHLHTGAGVDDSPQNVVFAFDACEDEPREWSFVPCDCDACRVRRVRNVTFIVEHENGERAHVGRECLKLYTGIDGATAARFAAVVDEITREYDADAGANIERMHAARLLSVRRVLGIAADIIARDGYRTNGGTRDDVLEALRHDEDASENGARVAAAVLDWCASIDANTASDYMRNACAIVAAGYCKPSHVGILAYLPRAYEREQERKRRDAERKKAEHDAREHSAHVGKVGERVTMPIDSAVCVTSFEYQASYYKVVTTYVYKIMSGGAALIWKTSTASLEDVQNSATITGTIKEHSEYRGERQTVLTRCKLGGKSAALIAAQEQNARTMRDIDEALTMLCAG